MKPVAFQTLLVLALLALAVGQKSKSRSNRKSRKSTTTTSTTTEAPQVTAVAPAPSGQSGQNPWYNGRGGASYTGPSSGSGRFPGPSGPAGPGPQRNVGRFSGPGDFSAPGAFNGRSGYQGGNSYQGPGAAPGTGGPQSAGGLQGSGGYQGPGGSQGANGYQGPSGAQGAGDTQGPNKYRGLRNQGRGRPGRPWYFLSWRHAPPSRLLYTWQEADDICRQEGGQLISIDTQDKQGYISWVLDEDEIPSVWTSGRFRAGKFQWTDGTPVSAGPSRWSKTGRMYQPQPDNAEGFEDCIAVLNDFFGDGAAWHDEQCSHRRHFVCEM